MTARANPLRADANAGRETSAWPTRPDVREPEQVDGLVEAGLQRFGTIDEIAAVIAFLASAGGAYITGTTITVDGGADAWGLGEPPPQ